MLIIREEQYKVFEAVMLENFIKQMVTHIHDFFPVICHVIGEPQVLIVVRQAVDKASTYEFTNKGPVQFFIELTFKFGSGFDNDPQYPWIAEIIKNTEVPQMERAEHLHEKLMDYEDKVEGDEEDATYIEDAQEALLTLAKSNVPLSGENLPQELLWEMKRIYPQKFQYTGETPLRTLIDEGIVCAQEMHFTAPREMALIVILMSAFGHRCYNDALYPWIEKTMSDVRFDKPSDRAKKIEEYAIRWLEHVLSGGVVVNAET